jgi:DNA-binding transcriptional LysR family regulator
MLALDSSSLASSSLKSRARRDIGEFHIYLYKYRNFPMGSPSDWESAAGRRLKLRHLRIFSEVVQHGSMAKAASRMRLAQPTVSEVIAELEHTYGVRLLDRSPQGVVPTVYGEALLKRSIAAFDELKQSSRDIAFLADPTAGELRIGCQAALAVAMMPPVVMRFSELYPRVVLYVDELPTQASQRTALQDRKCDVVLARAARSSRRARLGRGTTFQ